MMHGVPFLDLRGAYLELQQEIDEAVRRVTASGWYVGGAEVEAFEAQFARYCGARHCVGVANGLEALQLALAALGVGPGDEVIVASNTFIATLLAVTATGARPVLVEPDAATHNLDPERVEAAITKRTKVLLPTHLYGQPAGAKRHLPNVSKHCGA
jgi:dTDP-4-amino-4,6-dideoxygalactose transaminase